MPEEKNQWDDFATQAARAAGIDPPSELRPRILDHFAILADHAARVMALELDDDIELAPVFRP
jgi:hypothetical protein